MVTQKIISHKTESIRQYRTVKQLMVHISEKEEAATHSVNADPPP